MERNYVNVTVYISASNFTGWCSNVVNGRWKLLSKVHGVFLGICRYKKGENWSIFAHIMSKNKGVVFIGTRFLFRIDMRSIE